MSLFIGLTALQASQVGLNVISQNIANASTPGYHRQRVNFEQLNDGFFRNSRIGSGVQVSEIERLRVTVVENLITETTSELNRAEQLADITRQVENFFLPGEGSLQDSIQALFNQINSFALNPSDEAAKDLTVQSGAVVADRIREVSTSLRAVKESVLAQIDEEIELLNDEFTRLSQLNQDIVEARSGGQEPNGLLDEREMLINSIAEKIGITSAVVTNSNISLTFGNYNVQRQDNRIQFVLIDPTDLTLALVDDGGRPLSLSEGRISALVDVLNEVIPSYEDQLDDLASTLIKQFDGVHATGYGDSGPFNRLTSSRPVDDVDDPLIETAAFPLDSGNVYFTVTAPDGTKSTEFISIEPFSDSLRDVATQIDALPNLSAVVNSTTNELQITANAGYRFDFTGTLADSPVFTTYSGTSNVNFNGRYLGDDNTSLNFEIIGSGDVGISDNLTLRVSDENGIPLSDINIGNGYEAGSDIDLGDGVRISFSAGTVVTGDTFSNQLVGKPDETGLLSAIGLNSFFTGTDALTIGVNQDILNDPSRFSATTTGDSSDGIKIEEFADLGTADLFNDGRQSFSEFLIEITTSVGLDVRNNARLASNLNNLLSQYEAERDAISGVDINEEFIQLTQYQRAYEAAVRVIQTSEAVLDELFAIIR